MATTVAQTTTQHKIHVVTIIAATEILLNAVAIIVATAILQTVAETTIPAAAITAELVANSFTN